MTRKGYNFERRVRKALESCGWYVVRSAGSLGPTDLVAFREGIIYIIQCKSGRARIKTTGIKELLKWAAGKNYIVPVYARPENRKILLINLRDRRTLKIEKRRVPAVSRVSYEQQISVGQKKLEEKLRELQQKTNLGGELKVVWRPGFKRVVRDFMGDEVELRGEVVGEIIYIYEATLEEAIENLKHEFLDSIITDETMQIYADAYNAMKSVIEKHAYERKEKVVDKLVKML